MMLARPHIRTRGQASRPRIALRSPPAESEHPRRRRSRPLHDALLTVRGWPEIPFDGRLLVTQQDALLIGGKVQAMPGFADHVTFRDRTLRRCGEKTCVAMCSGQAITEGPDGQPAFEREKCVHCGACLWNCASAPEGATQHRIQAGAGGLHSAKIEHAAFQLTDVLVET